MVQDVKGLQLVELLIESGAPQYVHLLGRVPFDVRGSSGGSSASIARS